MEADVPEIHAAVIGLHPSSGQEAVLAVCSCDEYTLEHLEASIRRVVDSVNRNLGDEAETWRPRLTARVWSREDLRPCLNLSADTIKLMASVSASLDFAEHQRDARDEAEQGQNGPVLDAEDQSPELSVLFIGNDPETGQESVIAKVVCQKYSLEDLEACVAESIALAQIELQAATALWKPQVGVRLSSDRSIVPGMYLSAELVQQTASCEASLDFDPYV